MMLGTVNKLMIL